MIIISTGIICRCCLIIFLICSTSISYAELKQEVKIKDYGVRGHVFPIIEQSLLETIMTKLKIAQRSGSLEKMQEEFQERVKQKIIRPVPVKNLSKSSKNSSRLYDPSFTQNTDIKDQYGKIIIKAGTKINPLETISWGEPLILIDGDDKEQVAWAKSKIGKLVLTKGSPSQLAQQLDQHVFFDQGGTLTTRFKIKAMPAIVEQEGSLLKISEIKIN